MGMSIHYPTGTDQETAKKEESSVTASVRHAVQNELNFSAFANEFNITSSQDDLLPLDFGAASDGQYLPSSPPAPSGDNLSPLEESGSECFQFAVFFCSEFATFVFIERNCDWSCPGMLAQP